jgi:hypothetical protein
MLVAAQLLASLSLRSAYPLPWDREAGLLGFSSRLAPSPLTPTRLLSAALSAPPPPYGEVLNSLCSSHVTSRSCLSARSLLWQETSFYESSTAATNSAVRRNFGKADLVLITANPSELWSVWAFLGCHSPAKVRHRVIERTEV